MAVSIDMFVDTTTKEIGVFKQRKENEYTDIQGSIFTAVLPGFVSDTRGELEGFRSWWKIKHRNEPEKYPIEMPVEHSHLWLDLFLSYRHTYKRSTT